MSTWAGWRLPQLLYLYHISVKNATAVIAQSGWRPPYLLNLYLAGWRIIQPLHVYLSREKDVIAVVHIFARAGWRLPQLFYFHLSRTKDVTAVVSLLGQDEVCLSWCISTWAGESCHSWCIFTWVGWRLSTGSTNSYTDPPAATHLSMTDWNGFGMKLISKLANFSFLAMTRRTSLKKTYWIQSGKY